jgi:hypothetical protein
MLREIHSLTAGRLLLLLLICVDSPAWGAPPSNNLSWLKGIVGDGALLSYSATSTKLYLTELSTGSSVMVTNNAPNGWSFEFSPDSSKLAWIEGTTIKGRMRKGDTTVHTIATGVTALGGVHWVSNTEVVYVKSGKWRRATIDGKSEVEVAALTALGTGGQECDVKLTSKGIWCYVGRTTSGSEVQWETSDGKTGGTGGTCSSSFSPEVNGGISITGLDHDHKTAFLKAVIPGAPTGTIVWSYDYVGDKGFDNHRWSSNHKDLVVVQDEKNSYLTVFQISTNKGTWMGPQDSGEMYGDFTAGDGTGAPWPGASSCGNGTLESGETCDPPSSCPTSCDDKDACTTDKLTGSAATCTAACTHTTITACSDGDGCCPSGCDNTNDDDCAPVCGNGTLESGETCDPSSSCPTGCDDKNACTADKLTGSASACTAACTHTKISSCSGGDGCCPSGCDSTSDSDCSASCGNGTVEQGETCDPPSSCPTGCDDEDACTEDLMTGSASNCNVSCTHTQVTACKDGDGCCPSGCSANTDSDCSASCGNGTVEQGETCDPPSSCPTSCDDGESCTEDKLVGSAAACSAVCSNTPITVCKDGDGCCPAGCGVTTDSDCSSAGGSDGGVAGDATAGADAGVNGGDASAPSQALSAHALEGGCALDGGLVFTPGQVLLLMLVLAAFAACRRRSGR